MRLVVLSHFTRWEFFRWKFKFIRGESEFSRADWHFSFSTWATRWLSQFKFHVKVGLFPLSMLLICEGNQQNLHTTL